MSSFNDEEENAASLHFGKEFDFGGKEDNQEEVSCVMNDEVLAILQKKAADANETLRQTLEYVKKIAGATDPDLLHVATTEIRTALEGLEMRLSDGTLQRLHKFEVASLANLVGVDTTPEEAIAWIPSLSLYDDDSLHLALEYVSKAKSRLEL